MGYVVAAYTVVLGTLLAYGLWIQSQRRSLMRRDEDAAGRPEEPDR